MVLDGRDLELISIHLDGRLLSGNQYQTDAEALQGAWAAECL